MNQRDCPHRIIASWSDCLCKKIIPYKYVVIWHDFLTRWQYILLQTSHDRICITIEKVLCKIYTWKKLLVPTKLWQLYQLNIPFRIERTWAFTFSNKKTNFKNDWYGNHVRFMRSTTIQQKCRQGQGQGMAKR